MPKVVAYTPSWLSRPSAGAKIFSDPEPQSPVSRTTQSTYFGSQGATQSETGPQRFIANRGTEIFAVVGNKIRWADLSVVKDDWEYESHGQNTSRPRASYRTLITPVYYKITQLIISPSGVFLAICTEHTVHVAILPDRSRLDDHDNAPIKLRTFQLGPTTHVIPESPLASVTWHPLAAATASADCLVTVTAAAAVRIWEINAAKQLSFDRPTLSIDLRKLADGISSDQDFAPSGFGKSKGYSVDAFDMEVSAACFGGRGTPDEDAWASMTYWIAMTNGDLYALCPLLPESWMPTSTMIPTLSISAVSCLACIEDANADPDERKAAEQQYEWVQEIDSAEPLPTVNGSDPSVLEIRQRPSNPSPIPRLQGPFELQATSELEDGNITDIHVIAGRLDEEALMSGEDEFEMMSDGVPFTIICLGTTKGKVLVSLELDGVSGQWLPKRGRSTFSVPGSEPRDLLLLDTVSCGREKPGSGNTLWPMITSDGGDAYTLFITIAGQVKSFSLSDWVNRVGLEWTGDTDIDPGLKTRLAMACRGTIGISQDIISVDANPRSSYSLSAPVLIHDLNIGDMLLTLSNDQAQAALFDSDPFKMSQSLSSFSTVPSLSPSRISTGLSKMMDESLPEPFPTRAPYVPSQTFYKNPLQPYEDMRQKIPVSRRFILNETPVRLSPACLDVMTLAHRVFSSQTTNLESAAAELFRRCERLREELADQVKQMGELADRLHHITSGSESKDSSNSSIESRIMKVQERQKALLHRYENLRRKSGRVGTASRELNNRERTWIQEIDKLDATISMDKTNDKADNLVQRYETVQELVQDISKQCQTLGLATSGTSETTAGEPNDLTPSRKSKFSISSRLQKDRMNEVMAMVERESAVIDAVMTRLSRLNVINS